MANIEIPDSLFATLERDAQAAGLSVDTLMRQRLQEAKPSPLTSHETSSQDLIEQLELAIRTAQLGIWQLDLANNELTWNEQAYEIYGLDPATDLINVDVWRSLVHPNDFAEATASFEAISQESEVYNSRFRIIRPDGEIRYIEGSGCAIHDAEGHIVRLVGVNWDRTTYEHTLQQLADSESRYRALFENSLNPVVVYDEAARIVMINQTAAKLFGQEQEKLIGKTIEALLPGYHAEVLKRVHSVLSLGVPLYVEDQVGEGENARWYWSVFQPVGGDRAAGQVLQVGYNITERKQSDTLRTEREELLAALEQERHLSKIRSDMLTMISHEFRTPLAVIQSSSDILIRYHDRLERENRHKKLLNIQEQVKHLASLLDEITMLAQARQGFLTYNPTVVNVVSFCETLLSELCDMSADTHYVTLDAEPTTEKATFDDKLMRHALSNLITNAVKYSPDGGEITLRVRREPWQWTFSVQDTGIGIPPEDQKTLFQPFTRASNVGTIEGTGIGLSIVNEIARYHDGKVWVESKLGVGSTFTITIPIMPATP